MHHATALLACDPPLAGDSDAAIERRRRLVDHERTALRDPRPPCLVGNARLERVDELHVDALRPQTLGPA